MNNNVTMESLTKKTYVYGYRVMENDDYTFIHEEAMPMKFNEDELREIAEVWKKQRFMRWHSPAVLPKPILDRFEEVVPDQIEEIMEENGYTVNDISIIPDEVPVDLKWALNHILGIIDEGNYAFDPKNDDELSETKPVHIPYSVELNGQVVEQMFKYDLRLDLFNVMFEVMDNKPKDVSEFDFMKQEATMAYAYIFDAIQSHADKVNGTHVTVMLNDFPEEVHFERFNF